MYFFPIASYAEIHYKLPFMKPRYYYNHPEILCDLPRRSIKQRNTYLPILFIVKDADRFPVTVHFADVTIKSDDGVFNIKKEISKYIDSPYYSKISKVDISNLTSRQHIDITVSITYEIRGRLYTVVNDNYRQTLVTSFRCYIANSPLPYPKDWYAGDPHYHSNYTSDQVEFGADIASSKEMAKAMGLSWFFITDHSYDLDDMDDDYLAKDKDIGKWDAMKKEAKENDSPDCRIVFGEELSVGNHYNRNVHLLIIGNERFIHGSGDSAEKWFRNKPEHNLSELNIEDKALTIAAHPVERIPLLQRLTLRRGNWHEEDYKAIGTSFLQLINRDNNRHLPRLIRYWRNLLLKGHRYFIIAGNDAHGNFNIMRQIKIPFVKLFANREQVFGNFFTIFRYEKNDPIAGLKNGEIVVSNGPFLQFWLNHNGREYRIGSTIYAEQAELDLEAHTSSEWGDIVKISLHVGHIDTGKEETTALCRRKMINLPKMGYLRMSMQTKKNGIVFTNPIWTNVSPESE